MNEKKIKEDKGKETVKKEIYQRRENYFYNDNIKKSLCIEGTMGRLIT